MPQLAKKLFNGRNVKEERIFEHDGSTAFDAYYKALAFLKTSGYSYGSMCGDEPIGIMKGDYRIAKWKNLSKEDKKELDGIVISPDFRGLYVKVIFFED